MNRTDVYWLPASELDRFRFNSDRGSQFTSGDVADKCQESGLRQSVGRNGCAGITPARSHSGRSSNTNTITVTSSLPEQSCISRLIGGWLTIMGEGGIRVLAMSAPSNTSRWPRGWLSPLDGGTSRSQCEQAGPIVRCTGNLTTLVTRSGRRDQHRGDPYRSSDN